MSQTFPEILACTEPTCAQTHLHHIQKHSSWNKVVQFDPLMGESVWYVVHML